MGMPVIDSYDKIDAVLERVAAIREACGKYFGIAIDFHGRNLIPTFLCTLSYSIIFKYS